MLLGRQAFPLRRPRCGCGMQISRSRWPSRPRHRFHLPDQRVERARAPITPLQPVPRAAPGPPGPCRPSPRQKLLNVIRAPEGHGISAKTAAALGRHAPASVRKRHGFHVPHSPSAKRSRGRADGQPACFGRRRMIERRPPPRERQNRGPARHSEIYEAGPKGQPGIVRRETGPRCQWSRATSVSTAIRACGPCPFSIRHLHRHRHGKTGINAAADPSKLRNPSVQPPSRPTPECIANTGAVGKNVRQIRGDSGPAGSIGCDLRVRIPAAPAPRYPRRRAARDKVR